MPFCVTEVRHLTLIQLSFNFMMILGTVALVFYTFPYLGIMFLPLGKSISPLICAAPLIILRQLFSITTLRCSIVALRLRSNVWIL